VLHEIGDMPDETKPAKPDPPLTPPRAAGDKPAGNSPAEPLKGEVSRTDSPGAGVSAAPPATRASAAVPKPENPTARQTAETSEYSSAIEAPSAPADEDVRRESEAHENERPGSTGSRGV
jgi:hypothetical protein